MQEIDMMTKDTCAEVIKSIDYDAVFNDMGEEIYG